MSNAVPPAPNALPPRPTFKLETTSDLDFPSLCHTGLVTIPDSVDDHTPPCRDQRLNLKASDRSRVCLDKGKPPSYVRSSKGDKHDTQNLVSSMLPT